ncbi:MAG: YncE family protein [Gammaproteobacteria bacterium]|nr:YncE family protein [Gammaproteobacteria bacterium]
MRMRFLGILLSVVGASWGMSALAADSLAVVDQIDAPRGAWSFASIDSSSRRLYVGRTDGILAVDLASHKATPLPLGGRRAQMIIPVPGSDLAVATLDTAGLAVLLDGRTGSVLKELPAGRGPETAAFDPASGLVAVMAASEEITLIDPMRKAVAGTIPMGAIMESGAADGHGRLYVNLEDKHAIGVVDIAGRKLTASWPLGDCDDPTGLGYDPMRRWLISACGGNHVAKVVSAATGAVVATLPIGDEPDAVMVDVQRRLAFIPCSEGHLTVIDLSNARPKVIASVVTAQGAATGALDTRTGRVYLPVGRAPATSFGGRAVPGFAVLVVGRR